MSVARQFEPVGLIAERAEEVRNRVARALTRASRKPGDVTLIAVSKLKPAEAVREAFAAGLHDFGENRVQEALGKIAELSDLAGIRWHGIGHLQANKARKASEGFALIHTLDDPALGERLARSGRERGVDVHALVQVDLAAEPTKFGVPETKLFAVLEQLAGLEGLSVDGLMLLPPYDPEPERVRPYFSRLRNLRDDARQRGLLKGDQLSMGMSNDCEVAIEEGATLVRVGTALFGPRPGH
jgi:hypothetical protein